MTTVDFITALFYHVDNHLHDPSRNIHQAHLWPSEVVTLGLLHALKGIGNRPFYRWLTRDYRALFPHLPERTRLFRLFKTHQDWTRSFLAAPTVLGVIDTYGIELIHPIRKGRSPQQIGRKGVSNHRWIVGGKLCLLLNQYGLVVGWACATANVADNTFQWRAVKLGGAETPHRYSDHTMTGKQLPRLGIAGDRGVAHVHHGVLDIRVAQSVLYKGDIGSCVEQMHRDRVAQRMKAPLGLRNIRYLGHTSASSPSTTGVPRGVPRLEIKR